jgi:vitamin B12 transporter
LDVQTRFDLGLNTQRISLGYAYLDEKAKNLDVNLSRYRINSLRHHLSLNYQGQVRKNITLSVNYKFAQRPTQASYQVFDASMRWLLEDFQFSLAFNNLFNERYTETNQLPMPLGNGLLGIQYLF